MYGFLFCSIDYQNGVRMIISHTHKFIFIKSLKTAGTSIEAALSNYCSGDDVVVPINDFGHNRDEKGEFVHRAMNADEVYREIGQHVDAPTIKSREAAETWNTYFKFSIARNPWDRALSYFFWDKRQDQAIKPRKRFYHYLGVPFNELDILKGHFKQFLKSGKLENNDRFYVIDDQLCVDFVIRYENLDADVKEVCRLTGVPTVNIPHLKAGIRKERRHYSEYYDDESRDIVAELHKNDIRLLGYKFEQK